MEKLLSALKKGFGYLCIIECFLGVYLFFTVEPSSKIATIAIIAIFALLAYLCLKRKKEIPTVENSITSYPENTPVQTFEPNYSANVYSNPYAIKNSSPLTTSPIEVQVIKNKWYLKTWIICLLFAFWWVYGIPLAIGILLLVLRQRQEEHNMLYTNQLLEENQRCHQLMTPEMQDTVKLQANISNLQTVLHELEQKIAEKKKAYISFDDEILVQEFGLYKPRYDFASSLDYKEELAKIRSVQKELIKNKNAVTGSVNWTVNGNKSQGKKMVSDTQKLLLRAFNTECDETISKVKYSNFDASLNRLYKSAETISKLGTIMSISITQSYLDAKIKELRLAFEYQQKKQAEKEAARLAREEQREQAKVQRELEEQRKKIEKEQTHYQTAYEKLNSQLVLHPDDSDLLSKKAELENKLLDIDKALTDIDYRQANMKAGYVYIISNIGAFGENIYKIGMTRRLDPQERVDELGDASVPFKFDVHAMIFSDDAPKLEAALHKAFEDKKVNMVNQRREFFNVTLDEIKEVVRKNFDKTVEFVDVPDAEQYRISQRMKCN